MDRLPVLRIAGFLLLLGPLSWPGCSQGDSDATAETGGIAPSSAPLTLSTSATAQLAPAALPPAATLPGAYASKVVVSAAYALSDSSDAGSVREAPRVRLAQVRPIPLWSDGPALVAPQTAERLPQLQPLPPIGAPASQPPAQLAVITGASASALPSVATPRSTEMDAVIRQADEMNRHGLELAEHGAIYSAREEFIGAARIVAEALDGLDGSNRHQHMLRAGLKALEEVDDFAHCDDTGGGAGLDTIIAGHQTPVLKDAPADGLTAGRATSLYLTFAQKQLAGAEADIPAGSVALFGLGKIYMVPEAAHGPGDATHGAKAVALEQAAMLVDSRDARAANELGVLLVRFGRLGEAKAALLRSLTVAPQPTTWKNLAVVHHSLGENDLADKAWHESVLLANQLRATGAPSGATPYAVQWVDPATFARSSPLPIDGTPDRGSNQLGPPAGAQHSIAGSPPWASAQRQ